jgi:ethanolamine permease
LIIQVIGGQYFAWNYGLSAGFGSFAIATFFIATGYLCLCLCIAELSSGLPFAGISEWKSNQTHIVEITVDMHN